MGAGQSTLLLDTVDWDLTIDVSQNIAVATVPYSEAQDAASACRLFYQECYYDTTRGVPLWEILGHSAPIGYIKAKFQAAALTVPGVVTAICYLKELTNRVLTGQIQITDDEGQEAFVTFSNLIPPP